MPAPYLTASSGLSQVTADNRYVHQDGTGMPSSTQNAALAEQLGTATVNAGVITCDLSTGRVFKVTITTNITGVTFINPPALPATINGVLYITIGSPGGFTITLASSISFLPAGTDLPYALATGNINRIGFESVDGGITFTSDDMQTTVASNTSAIASNASTLNGLSTLPSQVSTLQTNAGKASYTQIHGSVASTARPIVPGTVWWVGTATPSNARSGDVLASPTGVSVISTSPNLVQQFAVYASQSASGSTLTVPVVSSGGSAGMPSLPLVGDTILLPVFTGSSTITVTSISDPEGNTWTLDNSISADYDYLSVWRCNVTNPYLSTDSWIVNLSANTNTAGATAAEFQNLPSGNILDQIASNGNNTTAATALDCGTTAVTTEAVELVLAVLIANGTTSGGSGWNNSATALTSGGPIPDLRWAYYLTSATGAQHPILTSGTARKWSGLTCTYKSV